MTGTNQRGPLAAIILASSKEDIRKCAQCQPCYLEVTDEMDYTIGELLQMASRDDPAVFSSQSLWNCDPVMLRDGNCQEGINVSRVIEALRIEATVRGYSKDSEE